MATPEEIKLKFRNGLIPDENDFANLIDIVSDTAAIMLPSQEGASGQYLTSDGTSASWGAVDMASKENVGVAASLVSDHVTAGNPHSQYYLISDATSSLDLKVDKVDGKGLSTNDFTTLEQEKLTNLYQYTDDMAVTAVPPYELTATINGHDVSGNPVLTAADVSAEPTLGYTPVNDTTTVNGKRLNTNISLSGSDLFGMESYLAKPLVRWEVVGSPELIELSLKGIDFLSSIIQIDSVGGSFPVFNFVNSISSPSKELILFNSSPTFVCRVGFDTSSDWAEDASKFVTVADPSFATDVGYIFNIQTLLTWCTVIPPNSILKLVQNDLGAWSIENKSLITGATSGLILNNDKSIGVDFTQVAATNHNHINYSVTGHGHIIDDVTGLQTALDSKAPTGDYAYSSDLLTYATTAHNHNTEYLPINNPSASGIFSVPTIKIQSSSTSALSVKDITNNPIFNVDTTNSKVGIGTFTPYYKSSIVSNGSGESAAIMGLETYSSSLSTDRAILVMRKARNTASNPALSVNGDYIGSFQANVYQGSSWVNVAGIDFVIDGTVTSGQRPPSKMVFRLAPGSDGAVKDMLTIKPNSTIGINTSNPLYTLDVSGTGNFSTSVISPSISATSLTGNLNNYRETVGSRSVSGAFTVALSAGNVQDITLTGAATASLPAATSNPAWTLTLRVSNSVSGAVLSYAPSPVITWLTSDYAPPVFNTNIGKVNVLIFESHGSKILGHFGGKEA